MKSSTPSNRQSYQLYQVRHLTGSIRRAWRNQCSGADQHGEFVTGEPPSDVSARCWVRDGWAPKCGSSAMTSARWRVHAGECARCRDSDDKPPNVGVNDGRSALPNGAMSSSWWRAPERDGSAIASSRTRRVRDGECTINRRVNQIGMYQSSAQARQNISL
jgi:hypothetical protein